MTKKAYQHSTLHAIDPCNHRNIPFRNNRMAGLFEDASPRIDGTVKLAVGPQELEHYFDGFDCFYYNLEEEWLIS